MFRVCALVDLLTLISSVSYSDETMLEPTARATPIPLSWMSPLQMDAGFAHAKIKEGKWIAEATRISNETTRPFKEVLTELINLSGGKGFSVYISPDGRYRPDDGR
jgi:hypothetical protein